MVIFSILLTIFTLQLNHLIQLIVIACFQLIFVSLFENCKVILQHGRIITLIDSKNITEKNIAPLQKNQTRVFNYQLSIPIYRWCLKHLNKRYLSMGNQTFHLLRRMRMYFPQRYRDLHGYDLLLLFSLLKLQFI